MVLGSELLSKGLNCLKHLIFIYLFFSISHLVFSKTYDYNLNGDIKYISSPNGKKMEVKYDCVGRISKITYSSGKEVTFAYDLNDNRIRMTDSHGITTYTYDSLNRLISIQYPGTSPLLYDYDGSNHITYMKYPNGDEIIYDYDSEERLKTVRSKEGITTFVYDHRSNTLSKVILPNGLTTEYEYDLSKRVTDVIHKNRAGKLLLSFHYKYDANDNCFFVEEKSEKASKTIEYSYDRLNRLTRVDYSDGTFEKYTYNGFGNRKLKQTQDGIEVYEYDSNNLLCKKGDTTYFYDEAGNLRRKENGDQIVEYEYDENDLLTQVKSDDHLVIFEYDGDGKRISKTVDGVKTYYINDAVFPISQVLIEADDTKNVLASYTYAERRLSYTSVDMQSYFYLYDHPAKNVAALVGKKNQFSTSYAYDGFGNSRETSSGISNPFQYAGEQRDEETGLIYLRNRYYDPELGRFITPDHKRGDLLKPQSWNPYVYVLNNPINLVDPLGLDWLTAVVYPPGTMTNKGKSVPGHVFIILTRTNGQEKHYGKYPTFNPFDRLIRQDDEVYPGSITHTWEISSEVSDLIANNFGQDGWYLLVKNNCADATLQVIQKYVDPDFGNTKLLGINNPTSFMEMLSEKNGQGCDYIDRVNEVKTVIWNDYENDAIAPTSNGIQYFWRHFFGIPSSGGVALNKTADLMVNLAEILGAAFDESSGQLILIGTRNYSFPQFNSDDFAVAVRSVFGLGGRPPQDPGISMDPYPMHKPRQMNVSYMGETANTEFGRILFEADKLLKCLSLGRDNHTDKKMKAHQHGFRNLVQRYEKTRQPPKDGTYTRLWFVPEEIRVVQSEDKTSMQFENVKMKVLAEAFYHDKTVSNSAAEKFASHFTSHYEVYAHEFPILHELKRLGQITGVVKWIKDNQIPFDLSFFKQYQPKYVPTPSATELMYINWHDKWEHKHYIEGGVTYQLDLGNFIQRSMEGVEEIKEVALYHRPNDNQFAWDFHENGDSYLAVAQTLCKTPKVGNVKKSFIDMSFQVSGDNPLVLMRTYNSFQDKTSSFGTGWQLTPAELSFPDEKRVLNDSYQTAFGYISILVKDEGMDLLYSARHLDEEGMLVYSTAGGGYILKANKEGGFTLFKGNKGAVLFDDRGQLKRIVDKEGISIDYVYEGSKLIRIIHQSGQEIRLTYDQERIRSAEGLGGKVITYHYDDRGQLRAVASDSEILSTFSYDSENRLNKMKNSHGKTVFSARYDIYGRAEFLEDDFSSFEQHFNLAKRSIQMVDSQQVVTTKRFDASLRLEEVVDSLDRKIEVSYKPDSFAPKTIQDPLGYKTEYEYNAQGYLSAIRRPDKSKKQFWYNDAGRLILTKDGNGVYSFNNYDERGRIIFRVFPCDVIFNTTEEFSCSFLNKFVTTYEYAGTSSRPYRITYPGGKREAFSYNETGQITSTLFGEGYCLKRDYNAHHHLKKLYDESGFYIEYDYDQDFISAVTTPTSKVTHERKNNVLISTDGKGYKTSFVYDEWDRLAQIVDAEGGITLFEYDDLNQLKKITFPNGSDRELDYNKLKQPIEEKLVLQILSRPNFLELQILA